MRGRSRAERKESKTKTMRYRAGLSFSENTAVFSVMRTIPGVVLWNHHVSEQATEGV